MKRLAGFALAIGCLAVGTVGGEGPRLLLEQSFAWDGPGRALVLAVAIASSAAFLFLSLGRFRAGDLTGLVAATAAAGCAALAALALRIDHAALLWAAAWILAAVSAGAAGGARLEPAAKMAGLGAAASLALLLGAAFLAALAGSTHLLEIGYGSLGTPESSVLSRAALRVYLVGIAACGAWVPFHFWAPDGLSGSGALRASILAVAFPLAATLCLARAAYALEPSLVAAGVRWSGGIFAIALLTVGYAGSVALVQGDAGRLLAYLTVARSGELLAAAVTAPMPESNLAEAFATHAASVLPAWLALSIVSMERTESPVTEVLRFEALRGWGRRAPGRVAVLVVAAALASGAPGSALFRWRPEAALATGAPHWWGLLFALSTALQWAAIVRLVRVLALEEGDPVATAGGRRLVLLWWMVAFALAFHIALSLSQRHLMPDGAAWSRLLPGM